jgi:hypothetical protein
MMSDEISPQHYLVERPLYLPQRNQAGTPGPVMTFLSNAQVPEANCNLEISWTKERPAGISADPEHVHDYDEIMIFWGSDHRRPQVLGAEIEYLVGGQTIVFNTTTGIFIPAGLPHGVVGWHKLDRPHLQMSLLIGSGTRVERLAGPLDRALQKLDFDYEQYVLRSPIREAGAEFVRGRTAPTLTYMSALQIPGTRNYIEAGWTFDMPLSKRAGAGMPSMVHRNYDEIVLHIGGDPARPEMLGADMEFWVGDMPLKFNTSSLIFIPKGLKHGPIKCLKYDFPHLVMAIMLGAGSIKEGWENSFAPA